jgi:hypothetical protein
MEPNKEPIKAEHFVDADGKFSVLLTGEYLPVSILLHPVTAAEMAAKHLQVASEAEEWRLHMTALKQFYKTSDFNPQELAEVLQEMRASPDFRYPKIQFFQHVTAAEVTRMYTPEELLLTGFQRIAKAYAYQIEGLINKVLQDQGKSEPVIHSIILELQQRRNELKAKGAKC